LFSASFSARAVSRRRAYEYAVYAATTWQIHPSVPPEPIHKPGVTMSQKIPRQNLPL
jgi:hypothetical protein